MPLIPFSEFAPDLPPLAGGSDLVQNVACYDAASYAPLFDFVVVSTALSAECQGAIFGRDSLGNTYGFAGTNTHLYTFTTTSAPNWVDASRIVGGPYNAADDQHWRWVFYGDRVIATEPNDAIQNYVMGTSTNFSNLSAAAPQAKYIARVRDNFIMVANTTDPVDGTVPWRVWWPAIGNPASWPTPGTVAAAQVQSDFRDLIGDGGEIQGIVGGLANADVAVLQRFAIWRGMYIGPPVIFSFSAVETARGCIAPNSIVSVGPVCYYLSDDGFYVFDGQESKPIGRNKVDRFFLAEVDRNFLFHVHGVVDPNGKMIYWWYCGPGSSGGLINRALIYNYAFDKWTYRNDGGPGIEHPVSRTITLGYTMEQLDAFGTMDTLTAPLDSPQWQGGSLTISAFDSLHRLGIYDGSSLPAIIDTSETQLNDNGVAFVSRVWPMIDTPNAQLAVGTRFRLADPVQFTAAGGMTSTTGSVPVRATGAFHQARVTTQSMDAWTHAQGVQFDWRPAGRR